jgi:hypothetical protein
MNRKAMMLGVLVLLVSGQASAVAMDTWSQISLQFTNLGRAEATDSAIAVSTITTTGGGTHLQSAVAGTVPGLSLNTTLPVTDPIVSNGGIVEVILTSIVGRPDLTGQEGNGATLGNISGAIASTAGGLSPRTIPSSGGVRICLVLTGCAGFFLPLDVGGTSNGLAIGGGVGGILTIGGTNTIMISVVGAPYTVKTVTNFNRRAAGRHGQSHHDRGRSREQRHLGQLLPQPRPLRSGAGADAPAGLGRRRHGAARPQAGA